MADDSDLKILIALAAKRYCQQVLVLFLREFFQNNTNVPAFEWNSNPAISKIMISSEYPEALMKVPCVIVGDIYGDVYRRTIGQEMIVEHKTNKEIDGVIRPVVDKIITHGTYSLRCKVDVMSYKVSTRRFIADLVEAAFRHIGIDVLKKAGITISNVELAQATYTPVGNQIFQTSPINLEFVTEWHKEAEDMNILRKILIKEINISEDVY